jgi:hypothetical protein
MQLRADAYRYCFLPGAEMHKTRYHPAKEETADLLFERTNELHISEQQYCFVFRWQDDSVHGDFIGIGFFPSGNTACSVTALTRICYCRSSRTGLQFAQPIAGPFDRRHASFTELARP